MIKIFRRKIDRLFNYYMNTRVVLKVHPDSFIHPSCELRGATISGPVNIHECVSIKNGVIIKSNKLVRIGRYTSLNGPNMEIRCKIHPIEIGKFCSIASDVIIQEYNHPVNNLSTFYVGKKFFNIDQSNEAKSKGPIIIGHDVWIGTHSVILSGVEIGNGAVIAANSVVNKSIPPYTIAAGSPAKVIKKRFDNVLIDKIQMLQWWNWSKERIIENRELFEGEMTLEKLKNFSKG